MLNIIHRDDPPAVETDREIGTNQCDGNPKEEISDCKCDNCPSVAIISKCCHDNDVSKGKQVLKVFDIELSLICDKN